MSLEHIAVLCYCSSQKFPSPRLRIPLRGVAKTHRWKTRDCTTEQLWQSNQPWQHGPNVSCTEHGDRDVFLRYNILPYPHGKSSFDQRNLMLDVPSWLPGYKPSSTSSSFLAPPFSAHRKWREMRRTVQIWRQTLNDFGQVEFDVQLVHNFTSSRHENQCIAIPKLSK